MDVLKFNSVEEKIITVRGISVILDSHNTNAVSTFVQSEKEWFKSKDNQLNFEI